MKFRNAVLSAAGLLVFTAACFAQTTSIEGDVIGPDGKPMANTKCVVIDRLDIKGHYGPVKTDKKGHYFHAGLPIGDYKVMVVDENGKVLDQVNKVRSRLGDPLPVNFNLAANVAKQQARQKAMEAGKPMTKEEARDMSPEEKAAIEKAMEARKKELSKNKELMDAYNNGMTALQAKQYDQAIASLTKASELDPKQVAVWSYLAEANVALAKTKTGPEKDAALAKGLEAYGKALELKPDDAAAHNNYALALANAKKIPEAQSELTKAAQLDPTKAGQYYYNLGAVLVNTGQAEPACDAFKKAIETDASYAEAQYQWGNCLFAKATVSADGKVTPVPGTAEAFQKYLELAPQGPNAESAKGMLTAMNASVDVKYANPAAEAAAKKKAAAKTPTKKK
jgi:tetratricopeptide (TPR) repeat protein